MGQRCGPMTGGAVMHEQLKKAIDSVEFEVTESDYVELLCQRADYLEYRSDLFKAFLDGAGFQNMDSLELFGVEHARAVGEEVAERIKSKTISFDELKKRLLDNS